MAKAQTKNAPIRVETIERTQILHTIEVEVDASRVRKAFDRAYRDLAKQVRVKGFRPGKAPRAVLEKSYGASVAEQLELMSAAATRERATLFIEWTDPDGNVLWLTFHELALKTAFTAGIGGASGFASGAFAGMVNHRPALGAPQWPGMGFQTRAV